MQKLRRFFISLAALLLFSGIAMASQAAARSPFVAADDTTGSTASNTNGTALAEQLRQQAKQELQTARQNAKTHTEAERMQACNARKAALTRRMSSAVKNADNLKGVIDRMFSKVQAFYTKKNLSVANYDSLKSAVETAQANAQTSINALSSLDVSVDCSSQTVADSVSAFQSAVGNTRDSLKAYRKALVDLINSLRGASTGAASQSSSDSASNTGSH